MQKILVVDDDELVRNLVQEKLADCYEIVETGDPEQALGLALQHKPAAILLDLMMPSFSGFQICENLRSCSYTSRIPIFVISGQSAGSYQELCESLGAKEFFEKPIDFGLLKQSLALEIVQARTDRRAVVRIRMRVIIKLRAVINGGPVEVTSATENVSADGFLCNATEMLDASLIFEVFVTGTNDRFVGTARIVRVQYSETIRQQYAFAFLQTTQDWILQRS